MAAKDDFPNAQLLWTAEELAGRLGEENLVILDVRPSHLIMSGIIPGAAHWDLYGLGLSGTGPDLFGEYVQLIRSMMGLRGVGMERTVVIYEEEQTGVRAGRAFWWLEYFGHNDAHVLDGGMAAWRAAGYETTTEMAAPRPSRLPIDPREEVFVNADDLNALLNRDDLVVLDTRSDDEYFGRNTRGGPRGGTIPGAVHLEWVHYLDAEGKMKPPVELLALFESIGVTRDKPVVPF